MATFEIRLDDFTDGRLDVEISASDEEIRELFESFEEDFQVGSPESFEFDLEATLDGTTVLVWGDVRGTFDYRCGRCLTERSVDVESHFDMKVLSRDEWEEIYSGEDEIALEEEDLDTAFYEGETVDVRPFIRDAIVMDLPQWPHCPEELREECDAAYEEHVGDETLEQLEHNEPDLRWWPLRDIDLGGEADGEESEDTEPN